MPNRLLVLSPDARLCEDVKESLAAHRPALAVQALGNPELALTRVAGGDIGLLIVDADFPGLALAQYLNKLRENAPNCRIAVLWGRSPTCQSTTSSGGGQLPGGITVLRADSLRADLIRFVDAPGNGPQWIEPARGRGKLIGFLGVKGGVGTTTVALNVACSLAATGSVLLAEPGWRNDSVALFVRTCPSSAGSAPSFPGLAQKMHTIERVPAVQVRFGSAPPRQDQPGLVDLTRLREAADYVVLDLGSEITPLVTGILPDLGRLGLLLDRDPLSLAAAKRVRDSLGGEGLLIEWIVVSRSALACPAELREMEAALGGELLDVIPPDIDLCCAAQRAREPLVTFEPDSLCSQSITRIARRMA